MRVQMPEINTPKRRKNAYIVEVKTEAEAAALVAAGGVILDEPPKTKTAK